MAEKNTPKPDAKAAAAKDDGIGQRALKKLLADVQREKAKASEHNSAAGDCIKTAVKKHGLEKKGLAFVMGLDKMEVTKRQGALRGVIEYAHKMGHFDGVDAFDDMAERLKTISEEVMARRHNQDGTEKADNVVGIADAGKGKDAAAAG